MKMDRGGKEGGVFVGQGYTEEEEYMKNDKEEVARGEEDGENHMAFWYGTIQTSRSEKRRERAWNYADAQPVRRGVWRRSPRDIFLVIRPK